LLALTEVVSLGRAKPRRRLVLGLKPFHLRGESLHLEHSPRAPERDREGDDHDDDREDRDRDRVVRNQLVCRSEHPGEGLVERVRELADGRSSH
jgi:hypothetical protein